MKNIYLVNIVYILNFWIFLTEEARIIDEFFKEIVYVLRQY